MTNTEKLSDISQRCEKWASWFKNDNTVTGTLMVIQMDVGKREAEPPIHKHFQHPFSPPLKTAPSTHQSGKVNTSGKILHLAWAAQSLIGVVLVAGHHSLLVVLTHRGAWCLYKQLLHLLDGIVHLLLRQLRHLGKLWKGHTLVTFSVGLAWHSHFMPPLWTFFRATGKN